MPLLLEFDGFIEDIGENPFREMCDVCEYFVFTTKDGEYFDDGIYVCGSCIKKGE